ncbi:Heme:hemopexin utilization protein A [Bordetella ansorpii]|uniref:Heme:hemopexin utilization protein A n=1 Tax=Bordetella ansorpii TaxID=288768 RepID=A0A157S628_9BORD|nr:filamentous haemagglutinin family protein [Bordetella ansorpii]SAI65713.1 Heme:hemopexin utilization protein A [Bordetella ansorpii]
MNNIGRNSNNRGRGRAAHAGFGMAPLARALAMALTAGAAAMPAASHAGGAWFAQDGAKAQIRANAGARTGAMPSSARQRQQAQQKLQQSVDNLGRTASAIAAQVAAQNAARAAALGQPGTVPDGLAEGGLKLAAGAADDALAPTRVLDPALWRNAALPTQRTENGRTVVTVKQTADRAILNWDTFNVGRDTTLAFDQSGGSPDQDPSKASGWAVLNRVKPGVAPSRVEGALTAQGTVMVVNQNGVVFGGGSQVNVRNLVAAAAKITDTQFIDNGLYGASVTTPTFTEAVAGAVSVEAGARIVTHEPVSVTDGGGYVLLLGREASNAGTLVTRRGQAQLAAGNSFIIRKGYGTTGNQFSTTRGNEIAPQFNADGVDGGGNPVPNPAGLVRNSGLILAREGDITLAGRMVEQAGVAVSTTSVNTRGTIHLLNSANDARGKVALGAGAVTAIVAGDVAIGNDGAITLGDDGQTALDSQRDALIQESAALDTQRVTASKSAGRNFDNYSTLADRRDQSRVEIVGGGAVTFAEGSLTLATGGQLAVSAGNSTAGTKEAGPGAIATTYGVIQLDGGARLDVAGSVGVRVAMERNNLRINVQGNELRDAPINRDSGRLMNDDLWVDRRTLTYVKAGTGGYEGDRWYTAGGLLEVGGYVGNQGHTIGEWTAQGGTVNLATDNVITQAGSRVNLSGGTLDVQSGWINLSWLRGSDGRLYTADTAPGDLTYQGLYQGYEDAHARWGGNATRYFRNPLLGPSRRYEQGYTVGRDAGRLIVQSSSARLEGELDASAYNGPRQTEARPLAMDDAYKLGQTQAALGGVLALDSYDASLSSEGVSARLNQNAPIRIDNAPPVEGAQQGSLVWISLDRVNASGLAGLRAATLGDLTIGGDLTMSPGGFIDLSMGALSVYGDLTARAGSVSIRALTSPYGDARDLTLPSGVTIDTRGLWTNASLDPAQAWGMAFRDGGSVTLGAAGALSLEVGSRIDASAGGAVRADGSTAGGAGGNVSLNAGGLVIDGGGTIASYGFARGGKLSIVTPAAVSIGGTLLQTRGQLTPGETAPFDLTVGEDFVVPAGTRLAFELKVSSGRFIKPGAIVPAGVSVNVGAAPATVGPNGWAPPMSGVFARPPGSANGGRSYAVGEQIPAGYLVYAVNSQFPEGYRLPADAFTAPLPIYPKLYTYAAGSVLAGDLIVTAGSALPRGAVLPVAAPVLPVFEIVDASAFFQQGFASYTLSGAAGAIVQPGARVDVAMPVYRFLDTDRATGVPRRLLAGDALAGAVELALPPLFDTNVRQGTMTQRAGADLSLTGGIPLPPAAGAPASQLVTGAVIIGEGAVVNVDPDHRIDLSSKGQVTIDGSLVAPGGTITAVNTRLLKDLRSVVVNNPYFEDVDPTDALSVWVGEHGLLDVSGRAYTALDRQGDPFGVVLDGGSVVLGSTGGKDPDSLGTLSSGAYVVIRPGARIDASGAQALIGPGGRDNRAVRDVASDGGSITLSSYQGFFVDDLLRDDGSRAPALRAQSGGAGASGGTLSLVLESPLYGGPFGVDPSSRPGRALTVVQRYAPSALPGDLAPGAMDAAFVPAQARISAEQIAAGGFDGLSLWGRSAIVFDGDVDLSLGRSLTLNKGFLYQTTPGANVTLRAPYVLYDGGTLLKGASNFGPDMVGGTRLPAYGIGGTFRVEAGLIDLRHTMRVDFDQTTLQSSGDLRFLAATAPPSDAPLNDGTTRRTELRAFGDIELAAAQVYPASGVTATVRAGLGNTPASDPSVLQIRSTGAVPAQPYSVLGNLTLTADVIRQGGVLRAPFGLLTLNATQGVELQEGSITSVSTRGLVIPFGGTVDGVKYLYNGFDAAKPELLVGQYSASMFPDDSGTISRGTIGVSINAASLTSAPGSLLDLSGGGQLVGGAFITGRGGSVDTLLNPLDPGGKVYAIVPGATTAPVAGGYYKAWTGDVPGIGQQITLADGVPGLPAGTYTLLPANYALLPGAWRIELGGHAERPAKVPVVPLRNGSYVLTGTQSVAGTGIRDAYGTRVTLTSGQTLRTYSAYNDQGYTAFQLAQTRTFGALRPMIEADGQRLWFNARAAAAAPANSALVFNGRADFSAGDAAGYDGSFSLTAPTNATLVLTGPGSTRQNNATTVTASAAEIGKVQAPNLYLGGRVGASYSDPNVAFETNGMAQNVVLERGASLSASQVVLAAKQKVTLEEGAAISTLGRGKRWLDTNSSGLLFGNKPSPYEGMALLLVSNGQFTMDAPSGLFGTSIELKDGASLYSEGTIGFYSDVGVTLAGTPRIGTRNLSLAVPSFNIGSDASLAAVGALPPGMNLNQRFLDTLFAGVPEVGAPALENLVLTANKSVNFFGSVDLDTIDPATGRSRLAQLVFNTPAIYGYGGADDTVRLSTGTLVWNNALTRVTFSDYTQTQYGSVLPGALLPTGPGQGRFVVDADAVVFGNPTLAQPNTTVEFHRLMLGFSDVTFNAKERITGNARGTVSFYQRGADPSTRFDPDTYAGTGGNLHLNTPLLTGDSGSVIGYRAGGAIEVKAPAGAAPALPSAAGSLGAQLDLHGGAIDLASSVVLPSGRLTLAADGDIVLADGSLLDVSGRRLRFFDVTRDTWAGDVVIESEHGDIVQRAGSVIDVSAANQDAGTLRLSAIDAGHGAVLLGGTLRGSGGQGRASGTFDVRAQRIGAGPASLNADFAALNAQLGEAGFFGARAFNLRQGDLTIGDGVKARAVTVSVDGGSLTVTGRIDASGTQPGAIRLAARDDLRLAGNAVLDAHGTVLQVDSYGQPIEAKNRGTVELTASQGWLRLDDGAMLDVSAPGVAYGRVALNARRVTETGGDVRVDASGRVDVRGASSIALNAFWTYQPGDADGTIMQDNGLGAGGAVLDAQGRLGLDQVDARSRAFHDNALANTDLQRRLAGLRAYGDAYHLRPGVEIVSGDASNGKLTIKGDVDLSRYRYGPNADLNPNSARYGAGEPLALAVRAAGDLDIKGSISDGFGRPNATPDDSAILLAAGATLTADYTLPENVTLASGTKLASGAVIPIDVNLPGGQSLSAGQAAARQYVLDLPLNPTFGEYIYVFDGVDAWSGWDPDPVYVESGSITDYYWCGCTYYPGDPIVYGVLGQGAVIEAGTVISHPSNPAKARIVLSGGPKIAAGKILPQQVTLATDYRLPTAVVATGRIVTPGRTWEAGETLPASTELPQGTVVGQGASLPFDFEIQGTTWHAGSPLVLSGGYTLSSDLALAQGTVLPQGTVISASGNVTSQATRPVWAVAPMLAAGSQSASIRLVGGADLAAADMRGLQSAGALGGAGDVTLNDPRTSNSTRMPIFSVLRTGTGDLDILAGGDFSQATPFGVYTAGTQRDLPEGNEAFTLQRARLTGVAAYDAALEDRTTWYPDHGGDLYVSVRADLTGQTWFSPSNPSYNSYNITSWLWRQGGEGMGQQTAWSINFGTYANVGVRYNPALGGNEQLVGVVGFSGLGALGGGNVTLLAEGDAGALAPFSVNIGVPEGTPKQATGLNVAVGATGRVTGVNTTDDGRVTGGTLVQTGGGDLVLRIGRGLNPAQPSISNVDAMQGTLTNLRGDIDVLAGSVGHLKLTYGTKSTQDPRGVDLYDAQRVSAAVAGPVIVPGDGQTSVRSRGDLVLSSYVDPTMAAPPSVGDIGVAGYSFVGTLAGNPQQTGAGRNWFSLWTPDTAVSLFSAGGGVLPFHTGAGRSYLPSTFDAVAGDGSIYYGSQYSTNVAVYALLPSPAGQLELLARDSIQAGAMGATAKLGLSGARAGVNDLPNPFKPAWVLTPRNYTGGVEQLDITSSCGCDTNTLVIVTPPAWEGALPTLRPRSGYFAFQGMDTPVDALHAGDANPIRLYAVNGDIVDAALGASTLASPTVPGSYLAAKAAQVRAGRDIVAFGMGPTNSPLSDPSVIMNVDANDVSVLQAGRDIFYANVRIGGPGVLEATAGRNVYQGNMGSLVSIGGIIPGDTRPGADIAVHVGFGPAGPQGADWAALIARYLDPANQADVASGLPLADQAGKVAQSYGGELTLAGWLRQEFGYQGDEAGAPQWLRDKQAELNAVRAADDKTPRDLSREYADTSQAYLVNWLRARYGFEADGGTDRAAAARAYFDALPAEQQRVFLRALYYTELREGGREYNDSDGPRFGSYLRGRQMIATLFPRQDAYAGDMTQFGASGIQTWAGGDIQVLAPGGQIVVGVQGEPPPGTAGLITLGRGDVQLYSQGSILLGLSRIMTTFGGSILAWSAQGDINAGRGSKTTLVYTPPRRAYDTWGNVQLSPQAPSTGAGIATLNPIPEVPPGDVDLLAPLGTIDAGEAGIRVSGNLNIAALQVVNAANIQVQGEAVGVPVVAAVNVGALTSASTAATSAVNAAQDAVARSRAAAQKALPSIISVQILGFGDAGATSVPAPARGAGAQGRAAPAASAGQAYDRTSLLQIVGMGGRTDPAQVSRLTDAQRRSLENDR